MRVWATLGLALAGNLLLAGVAPAALITGFPSGLYPDVYSSLIHFSYTYTASTGEFTATGTSETLNSSSSSSTSITGSFSLVAYVDNTGTLIPGDEDMDTLSITESTPTAQTLYHSGTDQPIAEPDPLTNFGWVFNHGSGTNYVANFQFEYVEDLSAPALTAPGVVVYVTVDGSMTSSSAPNFANNFSGNGVSAYSDAYPATVPEPSSAALLIGAAGLLWRRRRPN
jgi:hypothetical protein